jgi:hypothetical protein
MYQTERAIAHLYTFSGATDESEFRLDKRNLFIFNQLQLLSFSSLISRLRHVLPS